MEQVYEKIILGAIKLVRRVRCGTDINTRVDFYRVPSRVRNLAHISRTPKPEINLLTESERWSWFIEIIAQIRVTARQFVVQ